ncbi:uracil-DNA glycosylase-like protein [Crucibulum laeve]|uniref:Uracil-DNA glycosylase n=1 Tax=Crucibulum laeve TaxID=68775 RepID=A0A5C3M7A9_9AGAR|nr:uracil-DNA glycosylase-like protein [Crucibulum laeve]
MPKDITKSENEMHIISTAKSSRMHMGAQRSIVQTTTSRLNTTKPTRQSKLTFATAGGISSSSESASTAKLDATQEAISTSQSQLTTGLKSQEKSEIKTAFDLLEQTTMESSWHAALEPEFEKPYFHKLKEFLVSEHSNHTIYPEIPNIYSWSRLTPLHKVKVVIIGQDPYHNVGQAHGLSFSVLPPTKPPGSLKNIYKQLAADFPGFVKPTSGDLSPTAKQGVLWLNTSLTVRAHKAASHANKGWETFTAQALRAVLRQENHEHAGVVFMAWGLPAQKTCAKIGIDETKHLLLKSAHPSPLSAHRGFIGNGHFKAANKWLFEKYGKDAEIDWTVLSGKH